VGSGEKRYITDVDTAFMLECDDMIKPGSNDDYCFNICLTDIAWPLDCMHYTLHTLSGDILRNNTRVLL